MTTLRLTTREIDEAPEGAHIAGFSAVAFLAQWILSGRMSAIDFAKTLAVTTQFELGQIGFSAFVTGTVDFLRNFSEEEYRELAAGVFATWLGGDIYAVRRQFIEVLESEED